MSGKGRAVSTPEAEGRRSRIGALKQQLTDSDHDMAKLEDHIRGLLVKSKGTLYKVRGNLCVYVCVRARLAGRSCAFTQACIPSGGL